MTVTTTEYTVSAANSKHGTAKKWLQRHLRKVTSRQALRGCGENGGIQRKGSLQRPRTAPSPGEVTSSNDTPDVALASIEFERVSPRPPVLPPLRPARPDSSVIRDVNAWLDASMSTSSPPIMGGISYWRAATKPGVKDSAVAQHAIPLIRAPELDRPSTASSHHGKSLRRCAKKVHDQMPSLLRTRSQRQTKWKQGKRQSASMPLLGISYEDIHQDTAALSITRSSSLVRPETQSSTRQTSTYTNALLSVSRPSGEHLPSRQGTPGGTRFGDTDSILERRLNTMFLRIARSAESTRPSTAAAGLVREDSMGELSDAPTYFSGPPPPSYRSRPESLLTTSSFGCIDGMNPAQRQMSQQRAALQRGMKCKLKRFAQTFTI
ncbi:hypothetical protein GMOD_00010023 [Pyrenophora seminiperda CCB06]|uniref:Uncharacterized protein n=1 Tax=Pyrenophora seminiperda CCB06 TaxID=1302712 RepID=A0A3M7M1R4_9PLEO|nr:hypothetical protein GMOD_00010023 [Pyrenophora seminiperda CCB06]